MSRLKRLIVEIHRHSLWQIVGIYLGGAWLAYEIIQGITEGRGLPEWLPALALVLLVIGLPFVVATAFVHEEAQPTPPEAATPEAEAAAVQARAEARREAIGRRRLVNWRNAGLSFLVALALWGVVATGLLLVGGYGAEADERKSIAVLPFENLSPDPDDAYFTDGIHEEVLSHLQRIADLKVISRTSVMGYRERNENVRTIASELGVTHVLEGSVRRAGNEVRITTQLIAAEEDEHLWAENYQRELSDVFAVQADIAARIAASLEATLDEQERHRIEEVPTHNPEAYDYYLRGREYGRRGGLQSRHVAAERMFLKAVELDPDFAQAYAAMARYYGSKYHQGFEPSDRTEEVANKVRDSALRAVELDPDLAEAHLALGEYYYRVLRDFERALQEYTVAARLKPSDAQVYVELANVQRAQGEWEPAEENYQAAVELDPRDPYAVMQLAATLIWMRRYDEAMPLLERYVAWVPDGGWVWVQALAHLNQPDGIEPGLRVIRGWEKAMGGPSPSYSVNKGAGGSLVWWFNRIRLRVFYDMHRERVRAPIPGSETDSSGFLLAKAILFDLEGETSRARAYYDSARVGYEAWIKESTERPTHPGVFTHLGISYAGLGRAEEAIREAGRSEPVSTEQLNGFANVYALAEVYVMVGDYDSAIDQLETVLSIACPVSPPLLKADPIWDPLRDHPRFQALLEKYSQPT